MQSFYPNPEDDVAEIQRPFRVSVRLFHNSVSLHPKMQAVADLLGVEIAS